MTNIEQAARNSANQYGDGETFTVFGFKSELDKLELKVGHPIATSLSPPVASYDPERISEFMMPGSQEWANDSGPYEKFHSMLLTCDAVVRVTQAVYRLKDELTIAADKAVNAASGSKPNV